MSPMINIVTAFDRENRSTSTRRLAQRLPTVATTSTTLCRLFIAILLSPDASLIDAVAVSMARQLLSLPRRQIITAALKNRGALIKVRDFTEACAIANRIAPEHLELAVADPESLLAQIRHAGAIFLGHYSSEALGDYCAGPNHVLPTARSARFSSPLGVYDFQKRSSVIAVSRDGAQTLGRLAATLATGEGLHAHAASAAYRVTEE